jgi:hypothetical protein
LKLKVGGSEQMLFFSSNQDFAQIFSSNQDFAQARAKSEKIKNIRYVQLALRIKKKITEKIQLFGGFYKNKDPRNKTSKCTKLHQLQQPGTEIQFALRDKTFFRLKQSALFNKKTPLQTENCLNVRKCVTSALRPSVFFP